MARISPAVIDRVRDSADILDVVSQAVDMKRRGRNYFGLCPFHQEKTPSFSVAPDKGIYHCFGCGVGGNSINFVMEHEKLSFVEAVRSLGDRFGVPVEFEEDSGSKEFFTAMYAIHETAADFYHQALFSERGAEALKYLTERGLHEDTLKKFRVGFTPKSDDFLLKKVQDNYTEEVLEKSGLFNRGERGFFDRFRARIMFPISNTSGKVIAFGGRIFGSEDPAKYMNSPETPLYRKSDILYGLHFAREAILKEKHALLVEGYTDLLQIVQADVKHVVAVAGTALTENHVNALGKITRKVFLIYDGDEAGIKAAIRGGYTMLRGGLEPAMVSVPKESDPDDWIQKHGIKPLQKAMSNASTLLVFHLEAVSQKEMSATERSDLVREIMREAVGIRDAIVRDDFLKSLATAVNLDDHEVVRMFRAQTRPRTGSAVPPPEVSAEPELFTSVSEKAQAAIVKVMASPKRGTLEKAAEFVDFDLFSDALLEKLARLILESESELNIANLLDKLESKEEREKASALFMEEMTLADPDEVLKDCVRTLKSQPLKEKIKSARLALREIEAAGQDGSEVLEEITNLQRELDSL